MERQKALHFQIDPRSGLPVYRQLMDQIKYYVASGALKSGDQLPSIRDLAVRATVNPTTVVKCYTELQHEGVVEMKHGKGAFVAASSSEMTDAQRRKILGQLAKQLLVEAKQLGASRELVEEVIRDEWDGLPSG
jgi:DNA-binding transcriptional regulator YhcF (GntR family)